MASAIVLNLSIGLLGTLILVSVLSPEIRRSGIARPSIKRLREQSGYALSAYIANLAGYLDKRQDIVLLGMLSTSAAAGVYSVGVVFAELLWQVPRALSPALRSRSLAAGEERRRGCDSDVGSRGADDVARHLRRTGHRVATADGSCLRPRLRRRLHRLPHSLTRCSGVRGHHRHLEPPASRGTSSCLGSP